MFNYIYLCLIVWRVNTMMAKEINKMIIDKDIKKKDLAERCNWTSSNFYNKMSRDNFSEKELQTIANALDCYLKIEFIPKN